MTQVIVFLQTKGGAGKSTNLIALAARMSLDGAKVGVIDTDPQKDSSDFFESENYNVDCEYIGDPKVFENTMEQLMNMGYDALFVDTTGTRTMLNEHALSVADLVIIPVVPSGNDVKGAVNTYNDVIEVSNELGKKIKSRVLQCRVVPGTNLGGEVNEWIDEFEIPAFKTKIASVMGFPEMVTKGFLPPSGSTAKRELDKLMCELQQDGHLDYYNNRFGRVV